MFGREFVLQCWRNSFRKKRCSLLLFFLWLCFWMSLVALLYSYFSINEILSLLLIKKKEWLPQKGFSGLKIYQARLGVTKLDFEVRPSLHKFSTSHLPQTHQKLLSLQTTIKKTHKVHHSTCSIYLLTYSLVLAQNAMCVKPSDLLTRYVPSLWKLSHEKNQP